MYLNIVGNPDESTAVDYTVNAASGIATATGPVGSLFPVNNALPAWDIATGLNAVIGILAAERHRRTTGEGQLVKLSLADVAFTMVANLGFLAQAQVTHENRPPLGNDMYGAFGRDFADARRPARDGRRHQPQPVAHAGRATGIEEHLPPMERAFDADFRKEEDRYRARDGIAALLKPWFEARTLDEVRKALDEHGVCWGPYQTFTQLLDDDWRASPVNPVFGDVDHPGIGTLLTPASPLRFPTDPPFPPAPAPLLGTHTDEVLDAVLGLSPAEIGRLHDDGVVASEVPLRCGVSVRAHPRRRRLRRHEPRSAVDARPGRPPGRVHRRRPDGCSTPARSRSCGTGRASSRWCRPPRSAPTVTRAGAPRWRRSRSACGSVAGCSVERPLAARRRRRRARRASCGPSRRTAAAAASGSSPSAT